MKRISCILLALCLLCPCMAVLAAQETRISGDYEYTVSAAGAHIVFFHDGAAAEVIIPETLDGYPVVSIGWGAFGTMRSLQHVEIPDSVTFVSDEAFLNCTALKSVRIGSGVRELNGNPFDGCTALRHIVLAENHPHLTLRDSVLYKGSRLVCYPGGLPGDSYVIPDGVTEIGDCAFSGNPALQTVVIPPTVGFIHPTALNDGLGQRMPVALEIRRNPYARDWAQRSGLAFAYEPTQEEVLAQRYAEAAALMESGAYEEAQAAFEALGDYADSAVQAEICIYRRAEEAYNQADYAQAEALFASLGDVDDAAARARESRRKQIAAGDYVAFGRWEQDDDLSNGPDPIEWLVLDRQGDRLLVITRNVFVEFQGFQTASDFLNKGQDEYHVWWEGSYTRKQLNTDFLYQAFDQDEQAAIPAVTVRTEANPANDYDPGRDTIDRIFILSYAEMLRYLPSEADRAAEPTPYGKNTLYINLRSTMWHLRNPGYRSHDSRIPDEKALVWENGTVDLQGSRDDYGQDWNGNRPVCWIDLSVAGDRVAPLQQEERIPGYAVGETFVLGLYEQDGNAANGAEPVEWMVIHRDGNRALLLSRQVLWAMRFSQSRTCTWEHSEIRTWLNEMFLQEAFSEQENSVIAQRTVRAETRHAGSHTQDKVFLLSAAELENYLPSQDARAVKATPHALAQRPKSADESGECRWWLRSSASSTSYADMVKQDGSFGVSKIGDADRFGIRPAIWVNLDRLADLP